MRTLFRTAVWTLTVFCLAAPVPAQTGGSIVPDVVYGHKDGMALTFDVFTAAEPNGVVAPAAADRFVALDFDDVLSASVSPILHVSADDPPTLLVHGDADPLVDINNSQLIHAALENENVSTGLVVIEGAGHGFRAPEHRMKATAALVGWFERHLTAR